MKSKAAESRSARRPVAGAGIPSSAPAIKVMTVSDAIRRTAGAGAPSPASSFSRHGGSPRMTDIEELKERMSKLEAELAEIKNTATPLTTPTKVGMDLYSPESIAEYKQAIRRMAFFHDKKPLERYLEKTGGKVPGTEEGS